MSTEKVLKTLTKEQIAALDPQDAIERDAIHVPIILVQAQEDLPPGTRVGLIKTGTRNYFLASALLPRSARVGVVDPFIPSIVPAGSYFYCWLEPNSCRKLWYDWIHPVVDK